MMTFIKRRNQVQNNAEQGSSLLVHTVETISTI
jgi:hypothetical protein